MVRADLLVGCGKLATDSSGSTQFPSIKEKLADNASYASTLRAIVTASVKSPISTPGGLVAPNPEFVAIGRNIARTLYRTTIDELYEISAAFTMAAPRREELESQLGSYFEKYYRAKFLAKERVGIYRLVRDLVGSSFGDRLDLFQMFSDGPPASHKASAFGAFDFERRTKLARRMLEEHY